MTGIVDWALQSRDSVREQGLSEGIHTALYELRVGMVRRIFQPFHDPEYIWERDWEVLLVLDACRLDLMEEVAADYGYIDEVETCTSVATGTTAWSERNFSPRFADELAETTYITANPNSITIGNVDFPDRCPCGEPIAHDGRALTITCPSCGKSVTGQRHHPFEQFDELWRSHWNKDLHTLPPNIVTARAIETMRDESPKRLIVHYNQPHHPFVVQEENGFTTAFDTDERNIWQALRKGSVSKGDVWDAYRDNLRYVLNSVSRFLNSADSDSVAITSDHGNALGEWGIYGHPNPPVPIPQLVDVPYIETVARNTDGIPSDSIQAETSEVEDAVETRLQDLGYL